MRATEDFIIAAILPKARLGNQGTFSFLDYVLRQNVDETYFAGTHQRLFRAAVAANVLQTTIDDEILSSLLSQQDPPATPDEIFAGQIMFRDLSQIEVTREKLKILIPSYRDTVHAYRMAQALEEGATVLTSGLKVDGEVQQGYKAARTHIMSRLAELDRRETGVLPTKEIRETAHELLTEYEEAKRGVAPGIMSGFREIDALTNGFQKSELAIFCAYTAEGKALALDTPLPTPDGWTTMGEIQPGDLVLGADGKPTRVSFVSGIQHGRTCYRVTFNDGTEIVADAEHLWAVRRRAQTYRPVQPREILTTERMRRIVKMYDRNNLSIDLAEPLELPTRELRVDPYVLGAWLGDGNSSDGIMTIAEPEIVNEFNRRGQPLHRLASAPYRYGTNGLMVRLRDLGVLDNKHVPQVYLRSSRTQRMDLLRGLMDTDGCVSERGRCEFTSMNRALAEGVRELAVSLGIRAVLTRGRAALCGQDCGVKYRVRFTTKHPVFLVERKAIRVREAKLNEVTTSRRYIVAIEPTESVPVQCIQVENEDHLYLAGRSMIPTHNTQLLLNIAWNAAIPQKKNVAFISLEMPLAQVRRRLITRHTNHVQFGLPGGLEYNKIKKGQLDVHEEMLYRTTIADWQTNPDYGRITVLQMSKHDTVKVVSEKLMYLRSQQPIDLLVLDYASLLTASRRRSERREEITEVIENLKEMCLTFNEGEGICCVTANQISRKARDEAEELKKYGLNFASETSAIEKNADFLAWLLRLDEFKAQREVLMGVAKYRDGDVGKEFRLVEHYESSFLGDLNAGSMAWNPAA